MTSTTGAALAVVLLAGTFASAQSGGKKAEPAAPAAAAAMAAPKPGPEIARLTALAGTWSSAEHYEATPWGPAGDATGTATWTVGPGGFSAILDYKSLTGPMKGGSGHGVFTWDDAAKVYRMYWFDSMMPVGGVSTGRWEDNAFVFTNEETMMGQKVTTRMITSDITPTSHNFTFEMIPEGGAAVVVTRVKYTKK